MSLEKFGPYGGPGGVAWDDGKTHTGVSKISLSYKPGEGIGSFTAFYKEDPTTGIPHPTGDDTYIRVNIKLEEGEVITKVSGYIGVVPGADTKTEVIRSLTFTTNENEYTYGTAQGRAFSSRPILTNSLIAGFVGRTSTDFLSAIGIYVSS
ncbi:hypothetical protein L484_016207 [Morus notabilis]|uniref:Jacalin-type lectin domain-containing protein n=1 Tax=Morus notabilis TaxID=981085 RepID=W9SLC1_9ROSA|nr:jacalin-related lectin 3 [Morus notabilis]XP_010107472.1 jacalin-related lectin 3 [Morus notabilis]EXC16101.1 hypothetical protein L484_016205 [Morus notabilis]EXC16103.1 hypothetical protein L484_016207 [Morus notabilis]